jgi:hypothetical protein
VFMGAFPTGRVTTGNCQPSESDVLTAIDTFTIELVEANETPAGVIVRWPAKPSVLHPHRFPAVGEIAARTFAAAVVKLAQLKR